jgi:hypothetical protein
VTTDVTQEGAWLTSHPRVMADWPPDKRSARQRLHRHDNRSARRSTWRLSLADSVDPE